MPLMDQFRRGVDTAKFKANQLLRIDRAQGEIGNERREIVAAREKIATVALEMHQKGSLSIQELDDLCVAIDKHNAVIADKEALIASIHAEQPPAAPPSHTEPAASDPAASGPATPPTSDTPNK